MLTKTRKRKAEAAITPTSKDLSPTTNHNFDLGVHRRGIAKNTLGSTSTRIQNTRAKKAKTRGNIVDPEESDANVSASPVSAKNKNTVLACAKSLQILGVEKITLTPPILLANVLPIPIDAICSIVIPDQVLLKLYKLLMALMVFLPGIWRSHFLHASEARLFASYSSNSALMILTSSFIAMRLLYIGCSRAYSSWVLLISLNFTPKAGLVKSLQPLAIAWFPSSGNMYWPSRERWYGSYGRKEIFSWIGRQFRSF